MYSSKQNEWPHWASAACMGAFSETQEKFSPVWCEGILGRWAVIPVEFSSCTNKAEGITKASKGGGREESRKSPESEHLYMYLLQDLSAKQVLRLCGNQGTATQERRRREVDPLRLINHAI